MYRTSGLGNGQDKNTFTMSIAKNREGVAKVPFNVVVDAYRKIPFNSIRRNK